MKINIKKTKVMIMNKNGKAEGDAAVYNVERGAVGAADAF